MESPSVSILEFDDEEVITRTIKTEMRKVLELILICCFQISLDIMWSRRRGQLCHQDCSRLYQHMLLA